MSKGQQPKIKPRGRRDLGASTGSMHVAIAGAGASGLMAAIAAARAGARVTVMDCLERPTAKLRASGGGRCNLTNTLPMDEFIERLSPKGRFVVPALNALDSESLQRLMGELGVPTQSLDGFHVYPVSNRADDVVRALVSECEKLGVEIRPSVRVTQLGIEAGSIVSLAFEGGFLPVTRAIIATGGAGYPRLGGTGDGYPLAAQAGHTIVSPTPALVGLVTVEDWPRSCAGIALRDSRVEINLPRWRKHYAEGSLIFTHEGVSGPAVMDLSGRVARLLGDHPVVPLRVNLAPGVSASLWLDRIDGWRRREGGKAIQSLLARTIPRAFAAVVCGIAGLDHITRAAYLDRSSRERLVATIIGAPVSIQATEGFSRAMVTSGGVSLKEINSKTMASRLVNGLYFAGEVVDVDGPSGGFNLQWAFSSGWLAGTSAAQ
ncbi:NAD(P)/FAD-dependent oxidoreductase [Candidatus Fermentibacteria bacterium]|nr:NAD(P)/FAD-dependent oxidoreductase [Candidatus Fermentibacteria bacterium]